MISKLFPQYYKNFYGIMKCISLFARFSRFVDFLSTFHNYGSKVCFFIISSDSSLRNK